MGQEDTSELLEDPSEPHAAPRLDKRLTRRQKLLRTGGATLAVLVALTVIASQFGYLDFTRYLWANLRLATTTTLTYSTTAPHPLGVVYAGAWQPVSLPVSANLLADAAVAATNSPTTYMCATAMPEGQVGSRPTGAISVWSTENAGERWRALPFTGVVGNYCTLSLAPDDPHTVIVVVYRFQQNDVCTHDAIYLTHDDGAHWRQTTMLPGVPANLQYCSIWVAGTAHHLLLRQFFERKGLKQDDPNLDGSAMYHSENEGAAWSASASSDATMGYPVPLADGATLLAADFRFTSRTGGYTALWTSSNMGDSWDPLVKLDKESGSTRILLSPTMRTPTPSLESPFYLFAQGGPSQLLRLQIVQITDDKNWTKLPPLPIAGATPDHPGLTQALTVTPTGKLLALGLGPDDKVPPDEQYNEDMFKRQWLWEWDPRTSQWSVVTPALDVAWPRCSDGCWSPFITQDGSAEDLWLHGWGLEGDTSIFRIHLPS